MFVKKKKSQVIGVSLLRKESELTLCICIELYRLQIPFTCTFCSDPHDNFMTCEETEARGAEIIGQVTQTAKRHTTRPTWGSSAPSTKSLKLLSLQTHLLRQIKFFICF